MANPSKDYLKYTGIAFQMFFLLLLGWFIGGYLDSLFEFDKPYLALLFMIILLIGYLYKLVKELP